MWSAVFIHLLLIGESLTWQDCKMAEVFFEQNGIDFEKSRIELSQNMRRKQSDMIRNLTGDVACIWSHGRCILYNARRQIAEKRI